MNTCAISRFRWWLRTTFCRHEWFVAQFAWGGYRECGKCGKR